MQFYCYYFHYWEDLSYCSEATSAQLLGAYSL